jgi:hypothetical protein
MGHSSAVTSTFEIKKIPCSHVFAWKLMLYFHDMYVKENSSTLSMQKWEAKKYNFDVTHVSKEWPLFRLLI